jgi:drug/metabolite transporter (DMT)-like permease
MTSVSTSAAGANQAAANPVWIGWALALISTLAFSIAPPVARGAIAAGLDATALVLGRMVIATALLGITIAITQPQRLRVDRRGLLLSALAGVVNGGGMLLFFFALKRLDASIVSMLLSLGPLIVLTLLALRGEPFTYRQIVRVALGLTGVYFLIGPGGQVDLFGVLLMVIANFGFALHLVLIQWYLRSYETSTATMYITAFMTLTVLIAWLAQGAPWAPLGASGWISLLTLALASTYIARFAYFAAITRIGGGQMSLLVPVETLLTVTWSMLFLAERLSPLQWLGGALILTSALLAIQRLGRARWRPPWRSWARV